MNENDELKILIEAALDFAKSLQNIKADLARAQGQLKNYRIKVLAGLDKSASAAQIKTDLTSLNKGKNKVKLVGQMDKSATKKNVESAIKNLKNTEIKIAGVLDSTALKQQLGSVPDMSAKVSADVNGAEQVENLRKQMDQAGNSASGMAAKIYLARTALQVLRRAARETINTIRELDKAATDLAIVTGTSADETYRLVDKYNRMAKELSATTTQVSNTAASWLRQGKSTAETASLIEQSMILSKVAMMNSEDATKRLTSALNGYKLEAQDASAVVDKLAALDSKAAVTAEDLAIAMSQTASSANIGGVSMNRLLGYLTTVQEVTQRSAETIGQSFKTIFARIGNIKLGNFLSDDGEDLSDVETVLKNYGIALRNVEGDFRNFGDVLDDVYKKWEQFGAVDKRAVAQAFAGTRQQENFLVLMENYGKALEYAGVAADSAGTALQKFAAYEDSIEAKANAFTAAIESLTMDTIDAELVKDLIDAGTAVVEFADKIGILKAALVSLGVGGTLKGIGLISKGFTVATQNVMNLGTAINMLRKVDNIGGLSAEKITELGRLTKGLTNEQLKLVLSSRQLSNAQMTQILMAGGLSEAEATAKIQTLGLTTAQGAATGATWSLSAAMTGLGASIKAAFLSNPVGMIMLAVSAVVMAVEAVTNAQEEARQAAIDAANSAATLSDEIVDLTGRYLELSEAVNTDGSVKEDLLSTQDELIDKLGIEKDRIQELTEEYGNLTDAIKAAAIESLQASERDLRGGLNAQKDELLSTGKGSGPANKSMNHIITTWGADSADINRKGLQALVDAGYISDGSFAPRGMELWLPSEDDFDLSTVEGVINAHERLGKMLDIVSDAAGSDNEVYDALFDSYNKCSSAVKGYQDSISSLNNNLAEQYMLQGLIGNEIPSTKDEFNDYRQSVIAAAEESGEFIGSSQDIANAVDSVLKGQSNFAAFYAEDLAGASDETARYVAKLQKLPEVLSELKSAYDVLEAAQKEMANGEGLSADTIEKLASAEDNYLDYLYEENGAVKLNTEAWKENANAKMQSEMSEIQKEIDSLEDENAALEKNSEELQARNKEILESMTAADQYDAMMGNTNALYDQYEANAAVISANTKQIEANSAAIDENQGKLAIYSGLYGSITGDLDAYNAALSNFSNVANSIDSISDSFQTLAELQAQVANGFTMSLDKALEFAKVYPEILNNAQATADGQIILNEGVVNSFIEGKKAELDAQIDTLVAELESEKARKEAMLASAQAQLDLAKAVAEGEGDISKELAEYRINAGNAVAQALIDAGIDEAAAFKLAATAMAQNAEEFDRVAMEVCTDVNGNFNQAAYDLAQTMYKNLSNVKTDLASVARQAHETAKAIAGVATGDSKAGSSDIQGGSGGGTGGSNIKLNLTSGSFEGTEYTYTAKESGLEDFISQIELDISNYQDAISQINGQIATLKALKNLPLNSFKGKSSSGGKGSNSTKKEVEEYIASIEDYREAVERLRKTQDDVGDIKTAIDESDNLKEKIALEKQLIGAYQREQEALHNLNDLRDNTITEGVAALRELGFAVQYNADTNELWISNMEHLNELTADSKGGYDTLQEATNALRKNTEELIGTLENLNEENQKGSSTWRDLESSIKDTKIAIVNDLQDIVDQASNAVDEIQSVADTLYDAADEFAANDGFITVDTYQALIKLVPQYMQMLVDENGLYQINEERINDVIAARTRQLAVENAMSYVERLKLAAQEGAVENLNDLIFVTTDASNATWGLVYAELELMHTMGDLNDSQYQAALHNIQVMQDLAENAIQNIGKATDSVAKNLEETRKQLEATKKGLQDTLDELKDMQDGTGDLIDYVMEMLRHRIQQQIDLLGEMKDKYSEIIALKKESLDATKDEQDYQKNISKKLREMAKLQERINTLSLDDSRKAQAERAKLLEKMADLQEDLADTQASKSIEAQKEALDKMEEDYNAEKDAEIKILEESISSTQKLWDMSIKYIRENWSTLYGELRQFNYDYGTHLVEELDEAWQLAQSAAQRYGDFVSAIMGGISSDIDSITRQIEALDEQMSNLSTSSGGSGTGGIGTENRNTTVGNKTTHTSPSSEDMVKTIVGRMKEYGAAWNWNNDKSTNDALHQKAVDLAKQLDQYGVHADFRGSDGTWWITRDKLNPSNVGKRLHNCYHTGGFVGDKPLKSNERYIKAENGELMMTSDQQDSLVAQLDRISTMATAFTNTPVSLAQPVLPDFPHFGSSTVNNVTNNSSQPVEIHLGDIIVNAPSGDGEVIADKVRKITRENVNQIARLLKVRP